MQRGLGVLSLVEVTAGRWGRAGQGPMRYAGADSHGVLGEEGNESIPAGCRINMWFRLEHYIQHRRFAGALREGRLLPTPNQRAARLQNLHSATSSYGHFLAIQLTPSFSPLVISVLHRMLHSTHHDSTALQYPSRATKIQPEICSAVEDGRQCLTAAWILNTSHVFLSTSSHDLFKCSICWPRIMGKDAQDSGHYSPGVWMFPEFAEVDACRRNISRQPGLHAQRDPRDVPCHIPRASFPSVIGRVIVGPMIDVFVCDTLVQCPADPSRVDAKADARITIPHRQCVYKL